MEPLHSLSHIPPYITVNNTGSFNKHSLLDNVLIKVFKVVKRTVFYTIQASYLHTYIYTYHVYVSISCTHFMEENQLEHSFLYSDL